MAGNPDFNRLYATTVEKYIPTAEDNIFTSKPFLYALTTFGNVRTEPGGTFVVQPLLYAGLRNQGSYAGSDIWATDEDEGHTAAVHKWGQYYGMIRLDNIEIAMNGGEAAVLNLIQAEMDRAELSISEALDDMFLGDGTGNGGKDWNGLGNVVSATNSFGGIDAAGVGNEWWQSKVTGSSGAQGDFSKLRKKVLEVTEGNDGPTNIFTNEFVYGWYDGLFEQNQRFLDPAMANQGFEHIKFHNIPLAFDRNIAGTDGGSDSDVYVLNMKYLSLVKLGDNWFKTSEWEQPINQDTVFKSYKLYGQVTCSNRSRQGKLEGVKNAAS